MRGVLLYFSFAISGNAAQYGDGMADMIADKTDNVEVVVALDGSPIDDDDDIGNEYKHLGKPLDLKSLILRIMYSEESRGVPLYINNYGKADHGGGRAQGPKDEPRLPYEPSFGWVGRTNPRLLNEHSPHFEKGPEGPHEGPYGGHRGGPHEGPQGGLYGGHHGGPGPQEPGPGPYHSRNRNGVRPGPYRPPPHEEHNEENQHNEIEDSNYNEPRQHEYFDRHNDDNYGTQEEDHFDEEDTFADHERNSLPGPEEFHYPTGRRNEPADLSDVDHDYVDVGFYGNVELEGGHAAYEFFEGDEEGEQRQGEADFGPPSGPPGYDEGPPQEESFQAGPPHQPQFETFQSDQLFDDSQRKGSDDLFLFSEPGSPAVDGFGNEVYYDTVDAGDSRQGGGFFEGFSSSGSDQNSRGSSDSGSLFGEEDLFQPPKPADPDYDDIAGRQSAENFAEEQAGFGQEHHGPPRHGPHRQGGPPGLGRGPPGLGPLLFGPRGPHRGGPPGGGDRFNRDIFSGGQRGPPSIRFGF